MSTKTVYFVSNDVERFQEYKKHFEDAGISLSYVKLGRSSRQNERIEKISRENIVRLFDYLKEHPVCVAISVDLKPQEYTVKHLFEDGKDIYIFTEDFALHEVKDMGLPRFTDISTVENSEIGVRRAYIPTDQPLQIGVGYMKVDGSHKLVEAKVLVHSAEARYIDYSSMARYSWRHITGKDKKTYHYMNDEEKCEAFCSLKIADGIISLVKG